MNDRQATVALLLALCAGVVLVAPALAAPAPSGSPTALAVPTDAPDPQTNASDNATASAGFGAQLSSFMQASAVDANASAERGMWEAAVETRGDAEGEVRSRIDRLDRQLDRLTNTTARLEARRTDGTITPVAYAARASSIQARIDNLRAALNRTDRTARRLGVDTAALDRLRARAANATGPEVAAVARGLTDPSDRGPPEGLDLPGDVDDRGPGDVGPGEIDLPDGTESPDAGSNRSAEDRRDELGDDGDGADDNGAGRGDGGGADVGLPGDGEDVRDDGRGENGDTGSDGTDDDGTDTDADEGDAAGTAQRTDAPGTDGDGAGSGMDDREDGSDGADSGDDGDEAENGGEENADADDAGVDAPGAGGSPPVSVPGSR